MKATICIPVHDPNSEFKKYLKELVNSILLQNYDNFEVLISSNHELKYFDELQKIADGKFKLSHFKNSCSSATSNSNFLIDLASGEIVKVMHQDDFFLHEDSLKKSVDALLCSKKSWQLTPFDHLDQKSGKIINPMVPKITKNLRLGINRVGGPSVSAFFKEKFIPYDESMTYLFDCDWYLRMVHRWGQPDILTEPTVRIRLHEGQSTSWAKKNLRIDLFKMQKNHNSFALRAGKCKCVNAQFKEA